MLSKSATPKTTDGHSLVNPSDLPRAVAQTASNTPDTMSKIHDMTIHLDGQSCRVPGTDPSSGAAFRSVKQILRDRPVQGLYLQFPPRISWFFTVGQKATQSRWTE